ncbi:MAG: PH domain-containing protein [Anaerolineae bacterium]
MDWYPRRWKGLIWGAALLAASLLACASLVSGVWGMPFSLGQYLRILLLVLSLALTAAIGYGLVALGGLRYRVERNGIVIFWGLVREVIPCRVVDSIFPLPPGRQLLGGLGWPGLRVGACRVEGIGTVRAYAAGAPERGLVVRTPNRLYLISPGQAAEFMADYSARSGLGELQQWRQERHLPRLLRLGIWRDRVAGCLFGGAVLLNAAAFGHLASYYPRLAPRLALAFDANGLVSRIGSRSELLVLPLVGLGLLVLNGVLAAWIHRKERVLALLLLVNLPVVQILAWLATSRMIG